MKIDTFTRPAEVFFAVDKKMAAPAAGGWSIRCPLCDAAVFSTQVAARHQGGDNVAFIAGNVSRYSYAQLATNYEDIWGHSSR